LAGLSFYDKEILVFDYPVSFSVYQWSFHQQQLTIMAMNHGL
jgi:hypothetical protein